MIVMKFGGTSNQDAAAMRNVLRIVSAHLQCKPVVVISAIAKATNELEETARAAQRGEEGRALEILEGLFERHLAIRSSLVHAPAPVAALEDQFGRYKSEIQRLIRGIAILGELTPRTMDAVCGFGERLSSLLVAAALVETGVEAAWVDVKEFMVTDDRFGGAHPLMGPVRERLERTMKPLLDAGKVPVTQGFIGVTSTGLPTTMGRESSDYSASIIGAAMGAERVEIWTDVDGILSADPAVVQAPRLVHSMSFQEALELSFFGAKVLHPGTMLPVLERGIPVFIRNSRNDRSPGTRVDAEGSPAEEGTVKSIAFRRRLSALTVSPERRHDQYLFWESTFSILSRFGIAAESCLTSEYSLTVLLDGTQNADALIQEFATVGKASLSGDLAAISLVGDGIMRMRDLFQRVFSALVQIPVHLVVGGGSSTSITVGVEESNLEDSVRRLHREFFGP